MILVMKRKAPVTVTIWEERTKLLCISKQKHSGSYLGGRSREKQKLQTGEKSAAARETLAGVLNPWKLYVNTINHICGYEFWRFSVFQKPRPALIKLPRCSCASGYMFQTILSQRQLAVTSNVEASISVSHLYDPKSLVSESYRKLKLKSFKSLPQCHFIDSTVSVKTDPLSCTSSSGFLFTFA